MRRNNDLMMIPTVVLTAANDPQIKLEALRLGASDFLAKPVDPSELMLRLSKRACGQSLSEPLGPVLRET